MDSMSGLENIMDLELLTDETMQMISETFYSTELDSLEIKTEVPDTSNDYRPTDPTQQYPMSSDSMFSEYQSYGQQCITEAASPSPVSPHHLYHNAAAGSINFVLQHQSHNQHHIPQLRPTPELQTENHGFLITATDPLPQSPGCWENYSVNFGPPFTSYDDTDVSSTLPDSPPTTLIQKARISRRRTASSTCQNQVPVESVRKLRRREQNRVAAQRCRSKKKYQTEKTMQDYQQLQQSNDKLRMEVEQLEKDKRRLEDILTSHLKVCTKTVETNES